MSENDGEIDLVFCTDGIFPHAIGGMQRHSRLLIEELAKNQNINIVAIHPHTREKIFISKNISEISIEGIDTNKNYLKECKSYSKRVYEIIKDYPNSIIYSQGLSVWYKADEFSDRLIINPHGLEPFQAIGLKAKLIALPFKKIFKDLFYKAKYVVSLGGGLTDILEKHIPSEKIITIPNAVNLPAKIQRNYPDKEEKIKLFFLARFAYNKGIGILLSAIDQLNKLGYEDKIEFYLAGKGPLYEEVKLKNDKRNVHLLGFISDDELVDYYKNSDAFIFPTLFEGMPTVVLEAMSYKLPIIVSDTGATAELVDNSNGWLIEKNNVNQVVSSVISFFQKTKSEKEVLAKNSFLKVEKYFNWEKVAQKHMALFDGIEN